MAARRPHPFWTLERVARALGTGPRSGQALAGVSTDTRALEAGSLFVALRGERFDAHDLLPQAKAAGAAAVVVERPEAAVGLGLPVYVVPDTLVALGQLAAAWRRAWGGTVVAVAGSNGKTSTKELIAAALGGTLLVHATPGNFNNQVGVPLTLLGIPSPAQVAVVEIGTNAPGEVALLRALAAPDVTVLTSVGEEHLEGLGDLQGVLREECAVFAPEALAVVPAAHPEVLAEARRHARATVVAGLGPVTGEQVGGEGVPSCVPEVWGMDLEGRPWLERHGVRLQLPLRGAHQGANAMLALAVCEAVGVPLERAAAGIAAMAVPGMRGTWEAYGRATVINDAYNANPPSMRAALALLEALDPGRQRVAVLGGMRELGARADALHRDVAAAALATSLPVLAGVGDLGAALAALAPGDPRVVTGADVDELWPRLRPRLAPDAILLLKASRGVRLERLLPLLADWAAA
ncbi:MAG: UDP-N-acetylmuramoyl-tripeptide--D-alanyl-D-alanine ligase [Gemmatimonadetes bacterium]|nr:UDP-N-acetylmuramoyl-tripeptide--D-alanyl-D-alanine ligase [Gemmatimonadota bacterium]